LGEEFKFLTVKRFKITTDWREIQRKPNEKLCKHATLKIEHYERIWKLLLIDLPFMANPTLAQVN